MLIRDTETFLATFKPGDTVYYTQVMHDEPTHVSELVINEITTYGALYSDGLMKSDSPMVTHDGLFGTTRKKFVDDFFWGKVVATSCSEARQALATLKWMHQNDPERREDFLFRRHLDDLMDEQMMRWEQEEAESFADRHYLGEV